MNIYFAITKEMLEKHSMPEISTKPGHYHWTLSESTEAYGIAPSIDELLKLVEESQKSFTICGARIESAKTLSEVLNSVIFGGTMNVPVVVFEMLHVTRG